MRNRLNEIAVVRLDRSYTSGVVVRAITDEDFDVPTTVAAFGPFLYAVNALRHAADPGHRLHGGAGVRR